MTTTLRPPPPSRPLARLRLAPPSDVPRHIDGAWWPRSYDLLEELPQLLSGLPRAWGQIVSVLVNGTTWPVGPDRMLVGDQVVQLHRTTAVHAPDTVVLLTPGLGRWDLLVVPPRTTEEAAERLMAAAAR
ncbi:DUF5994 family protein [Streptomyces sp. NPDC052701]|uniref:DUF5994 family protein n=1 Tax=Streptomyces sp. NPDC052701 TaxID=3155533 RepID=UPI00343CCDEE